MSLSRRAFKHRLSTVFMDHKQGPPATGVAASLFPRHPPTGATADVHAGNAQGILTSWAAAAQLQGLPLQNPVAMNFQQMQQMFAQGQRWVIEQALHAQQQAQREQQNAQEERLRAQLQQSQLQVVAPASAAAASASAAAASTVATSSIRPMHNVDVAPLRVTQGGSLPVAAPASAGAPASPSNFYSAPAVPVESRASRGEETSEKKTDPAVSVVSGAHMGWSVGSRVSVYWDGEKRWFNGTVKARSREKGYLGKRKFVRREFSKNCMGACVSVQTSMQLRPHVPLLAL